MIRAKASAPASIGNLGVGFDVLGQAFDAVRDTVTVERESRPGVRLGEVTGLVTRLPDAPSRNTALAAARAVLDAAGRPFGVRVHVHKAIPLSAGMGGSAASAVAAAAAVNALLSRPFATEDLLEFALEGERASADPPPWDNVMAALHGGIVMAAATDPALIRPVPAPAGLVSILLHPDAQTETQHARNVLKPEVAMEIAVEHSRALAGFVLGCVSNDRALIAACLRDRLVEPQRRFLLPEFEQVQAAALQAGALGCSFSGSGPSLFAWADESDADYVEQAMSAAFDAAGRSFTAYRSAIDAPGVKLEPVREIA
ncbi:MULTISPECIES: homoserine kinase [Marinicauda]|uniref:homoserine kinase n=1 Tax=Marinicauda TaxID=1649466 RepID=UPI0022E1669B|nr:homoserine kinase [Marinicauda sp. Alg238-R41]